MSLGRKIGPGDFETRNWIAVSETGFHVWIGGFNSWAEPRKTWFSPQYFWIGGISLVDRTNRSCREGRPTPRNPRGALILLHMKSDHHFFSTTRGLPFKMIKVLVDALFPDIDAAGANLSTASPLSSSESAWSRIIPRFSRLFARKKRTGSCARLSREFRSSRAARRKKTSVRCKICTNAHHYGSDVVMMKTRPI
jgi:hypothetical protein